jgi:hypothetical protein
MNEKILTHHPQAGKQGVRISKAKYEMVREAILQALRREGDLTFSRLTEVVGAELKGKFDGSVPWYVTTVKLDLEARGLVRRVPGSSPQRLQLPR